MLRGFKYIANNRPVRNLIVFMNTISRVGERAAVFASLILIIFPLISKKFALQLLSFTILSYALKASTCLCAFLNTSICLNKGKISLITRVATVSRLEKLPAKHQKSC